MSNEDLIKETIAKHIREACKNYIGESVDVDKLNQVVRDVLKKLINQLVIQKCLYCGASCPEGNCQLGSE